MEEKDDWGAENGSEGRAVAIDPTEDKLTYWQMVEGQEWKMNKKIELQRPHKQALPFWWQTEERWRWIWNERSPGRTDGGGGKSTFICKFPGIEGWIVNKTKELWHEWNPRSVAFIKSRKDSSRAFIEDQYLQAAISTNSISSSSNNSFSRRLLNFPGTIYEHRCQIGQTAFINQTH